MTGTVITHIEWRAASADELTGRRYIARTRLGTVVDGVFAADVHADRYEQTLADRDIEALPVLRFRRFLPPTRRCGFCRTLHVSEDRFQPAQWRRPSAQRGDGFQPPIATSPPTGRH